MAVDKTITTGDGDCQHRQTASPKITALASSDSVRLIKPINKCLLSTNHLVSTGKHIELFAQLAETLPICYFANISPPLNQCWCDLPKPSFCPSVAHLNPVICSRLTACDICSAGKASSRVSVCLNQY